MKKILPFGLIIFLAACSSTSHEVALEQSRQSCLAYGFVEGTPAFAQCMMLLDQQRQANAAQQRMAIGAALQQMGGAMQGGAVNCTTTYTPSGILGRPPVGSTTACY